MLSGIMWRIARKPRSPLPLCPCLPPASLLIFEISMKLFIELLGDFAFQEKL